MCIGNESKKIVSMCRSGHTPRQTNLWSDDTWVVGQTDRVTDCSYSFLRAQFKYMIFTSVFSFIVSPFHDFISYEPI